MKTEYPHLQEVLDKIKQANKDIKDNKAYKNVIEGLGYLQIRLDMKFIIKKWGDSLVILLNKDTQQIFGIKEGDIVDVEIKKIKKGEGKQNDNQEPSE